MAADVVLSVVETDLRLLAAEAKKAEGPMTNLMGMLHHSDLPAVKDATDRALQKVRTVEHGGISGVQQALEILAPFARACETKYAKLACIGISAFQKLLANDAVSIRGRCEIIKALQAAERLSDESVKLRILQASLTIIQSPSFADEQDAIQQLLSITFRLYVNNKSNFAVHSTAAATIRQAVALVFDHSLLGGRATDAQATASSTASLGSSPVASLSTPLRSGYSTGGANSPGPPPSGTAGGEGTGQPGRELVPVLLLEEMMGWLGARDGKELGWIQLQQKSGGNKVDRTFLLEMLEAVLLQRSLAIHRLPGLAQCVKTKVAPAVNGLLDSACDRLVDPNDAVDCRMVVRCAAALVRRHHDLAPERAAAMVVRLAETAGSVGRPGASQRWQRFMVLQALRPVLADPSLLYRLYHMSLPTGGVGALRDSNGGAVAITSSSNSGGGSVLSIVVQSLHDALRWYVRTSIETPEDDVVAALGNLYLQRAMGARDSVQETEAFGTNLAHGSEVVIAHLALECMLAMVAATEALTDVVVVPAEPGMPSPKLITRDTPDVKCVAVAGLVSELWRCVLAVCNTLLARAGHEVLVGLLVRGMQGITYSAGALGVMDARDALLHALCAHTLLPPGEDDAAALAAGTSAGTGAVGSSSAFLLQAEDRSVSSRRLAVTAAAASGGSSGSVAAPSAAAPAPGFLTAILVERSATSVRVVLTPRNIAALRALFNLAHRLADGLGSCGWLYVVDAVNALDRILASPHTTTAAYLLETGNDGEAVLGLQPMNSTAVPITGPGAGGALGAAGAGAGGQVAGAAGAIALAATVPPATPAAGDGGTDDISTTAQRELRILAGAADQLFENTHHMSPEAVVSLLSALSDISHRTLSGLGLLAGGGATGAASGGGAVAGVSGGSAAAAAAAVATAAAAAAQLLPSSGSGGALVVSGGPAGGPMGPSAAAAVAAATPGAVRLCALNRMVDTLLHNLWRVQDLWGIFLAHVLEVLASNNVQVRASAVDALDRTITGALNPDLHVPDKFTAPLPGLEDALSPASATAAATAAARKALLPGLSPYEQGTPPGAPPQGSLRDLSTSGLTPPVSPGLAAAAAVAPRAGSVGSGGVYGAQVTSTATPSPAAPSTRRVSYGGVATAAISPPNMSRLSTDFPLRSPVYLPSSSPGPAAASSSSSPFASSLSNAAAATAITAATAPAAAPPCTALVANRGVQQSAQREDVQHMLLVALDSLYREGGRSPDVRRGLLRIALHVLQHHGDGLTRGWVPMLRLLDAVPRAGQGAADVRLGFQVVELLATDYLASSLPKVHLAKALDVIAKFATQDTVLNVSLSSITMLWNVTDHLARSRGTFSKAAGAAQHPHQQQQQQAAAAAAATTPAIAIATPPPPPSSSSQAAAAASSGPYAGNSAAPGSSPFSSSSLYGIDTAAGGEKQMSPAFLAALSFARGVPSLPAASSPERSPWALQQQQPAAAAAPATAAITPAKLEVQVQAAQQPAGGSSAAAGGGLYPLHDLDEAESIAMLMIAFRSLKALSIDPRPEARNAAVRTLFLAVGSHGGKFPATTWQELFWSLLFDLLLTIHRVSATSSVEEAAAVELGKEKGGRPVVMLVHHSRNSEQKQWDETLVLALGGAAKVMRSYMQVLSGLDVWSKAWEELMQVIGELLSSGRKGLCLASTSLLTTVLQAHGSGPLVSRSMWQQTLSALDRGVNAMTSPNTPAPLQARAELLTCITTLASQLLLARCPRPGAAAAAAAAAASSNGDGAAGAVTLTSVSAVSFSAVAVVASPDPEQLLLVLRWMDRFARYPVGADDTSSIHFTTIGPIQKAVLAALTSLAPAAAAAGVWPAVLSLLCNMLRPFSTLALRQYAQQAAALQQQRKTAASAAQWSSFSHTPEAAAAAASAAPSAASVPALDSMASYASATTAAGSSRETSVHNPGTGGSGVSPWLVFACFGEVMEARAMSPLWMARVVELLAAWYRDLVSWQVRVATFPLLVGAMSECMACRHLLPGAAHSPGPALGPAAGAGAGSAHPLLFPQLHLAGDPGEAQALEELWRAAARGFVTVVQTGLPSINICSNQGQQQQQQVVPHSTWPALARAFQMFFLASNLPPLLQPPPERQHALALSVAAAGGSGATASYFRRMSSSAEPPAATPLQPSLEQLAADLEITTTVLDCLSETVLSSCQHAPVEVRRALVEVLDMGAASAAAPSAAGISAAAAADKPYDESGLPSNSRLSHVCLNKLYVLCSRGQEAPAGEVDGRDPAALQQPGVRSQLEVAQLALPIFVSRCEAILHEYSRAEQRTRSASTFEGHSAATGSGSRSAAGAGGAADRAPSFGGAAGTGMSLAPLRTAPSVGGPCSVSAALHDKALHVLELLQQLRVVPPVSDSLLVSRPHLRFWLEVVRAVRAHAALPPPALAAGAAAAAAATGQPSIHPMPSFGGGISATGSGVLASPPGISRRSSSGFELMSPTAAATAAVVGGGGFFGSVAAPASEPPSSNAPPPARSSSFFSRTYSSTGALLSSALGGASGSGSGSGSAATGGSAFAGTPNPPKRPSGSGSGAASGGGGGGGGAAGQLAESRSVAAPVVSRNAGSASGPAGYSHGPPSLASTSSAGGGGGLTLSGKSLLAKEQPQLPALYGVLCECIGSSDPVVRTAVQGMLSTLGGGLGLCAATPTTPQPPLF